MIFIQVFATERKKQRTLPDNEGSGYSILSVNVLGDVTYKLKMCEGQGSKD